MPGIGAGVLEQAQSQRFDASRRGRRRSGTRSAAPRPWPIATRFSLRVSVQRTGRPVARASQATSTSSVERPLAPKPPPTSGRDHPHLLGLEPERGRQPVAVLVRGLGREPDRQPAVVLEPRGGGARLDRAGGDALAGDAARRDHLAAVEQLLGGAGTRAAQADVGARSPRTAAPRRRARRSVRSTTGSGSYSTSTSSAASTLALAARLSTTATMSPTNLTLSVARYGRCESLVHRYKWRRRVARDRRPPRRTPARPASSAAARAVDSDDSGRAPTASARTSRAARPGTRGRLRMRPGR